METKKNILVVEDDPSLLKVISKMLEHSGFLVATARNVDDALRCLRDSTVDAIWLDHYLLDDKNGLDFVSIAKGNEQWRNMPIFVVSNTASPDKVQAYNSLGVEKFFTKANSSLAEIIQEIKNFFSKTV